MYLQELWVNSLWGQWTQESTDKKKLAEWHPWKERLKISKLILKKNKHFLSGRLAGPLCPRDERGPHLDAASKDRDHCRPQGPASAHQGEASRGCEEPRLVFLSRLSSMCDAPSWTFAVLQRSSQSYFQANLSDKINWQNGLFLGQADQDKPPPVKIYMKENAIKIFILEKF